MRSIIPALILLAAIALTFLWLSVRRSRIVDEPEPCSDYDGEGRRG